MAESNSSNTAWRDIVAAAATLIVGTGTCYVVSLAYQASKKKLPTRRGIYACSCGKVKAEIVMPAANYRYSEPPCFQCTCHDCVNFCNTVLASGNNKEMLQKFCSPGVPNLILYDSEIKFVDNESKGEQEQYLQSMKLSKGSENRRVYASCCGTPLAISVDGTSLNMIFTPNLKPTPVRGLGENETPFPVLEPTICLYHSNASQGALHSPSAMKLVGGINAPRFIGFCLWRLALLLVVGERGPGQGFPTTGSLTIGLGSIRSG